MILPLAIAGSADPLLIVLVLALVLLSLGLHEMAHAWVAYLRGDSTARDLGRLTADPFAHVDLFWTILLPAILLLSNSGFLFGGAKPVPVNYYRLRHPARDMMLVAIAGPLANVLIATLLLLVLKVLVYQAGIGPDTLVYDVLRIAVQFNLVIAIFNMVPVPPLDGSRVLNWLLPASLRPAYMSFERYAMLLLFGLVFFTDFFGRAINAAYQPLLGTIDWLTGGNWVVG